MNIFYLDKDPRLCAQYHTDKHVVKMILESAQLLCTAVNVLAGEQVTPYKSTHVNHPCSIWVRETPANWLYVYDLFLALEVEWTMRYRHTKTHKSIEALLNADILDLSVIAFKEERLRLPFVQLARELTKPALAMPDHCKISSDPVECYREYYRKEKIALHKWTNREVPFWL